METIQAVLKQPQKLPIAPSAKPKPTRNPLSVETRKPDWWSNGVGANLPSESLVRCHRCQGHGSGAGRVLDRISNVTTGEIIERGCIACWDGYANGPCPAHVCHYCDGSGLVCPTCRGD